MPTIKTKMSKSAWILIALLVIAIIAIPILHFTGVIDLSFIGDGFMGVQLWSADSVINALLLDVGLFAFGVLVFYLLKKYIIGTKLPSTTPYTPLGSTIPQQESKEEVTVT